MILTLFLVFVAICLVLITIGLARPSESAQAIIGFFLLFLLSVTVIIPGQLQYQSGTETNTTYTYFNSTSDQINETSEISIYTYDNYTDQTGASGFGYWLAIASAVGMIGVFYSLRRTNWREE